MSTMDDALAFVKKDPVAGFVAIPIIGARPPKERIIVQLKGRSLVLPAWTGDEWRWYGDIAFKYADSVNKTARGRDDVERANRRLTAIPMTSGSTRPDDSTAAAYYDAAVKLVIAAHVAGDRETGPLFVDTFKDSLTRVPKTIGESLAAALGAGGDILKPIVSEALKITSEVFEQTFGIGLGVIAIVAVGLWLWSKQSKGE